MQDIWRGIGFYALMFYSAIIDINEELFDSSKVDGANAFALIRYIILPMIKPIIAVATVYSLNGTLKALETALALTKGGPGYATMLTNIYMFNVSFNYREYGYGSAIAVFLLIQCLLLTMLVKRLFSGDVDT
jgi:raffinose/stachyose/melibiose transport system permease protein